MTPHGHLTSLTRKLAGLERCGTRKTFDAYVTSPEFLEHMQGVLPDLKKRDVAIRAYQRAKAVVIAKAPGPRPAAPRRRSRPYWDNPVMLAKLANAYARAGAGNHKQAALLLGVTPGAARLAAKAYLTSSLAPTQIAA